MIDRPADRERLVAALARAPVVLLTGPRQIGKTTLVRELVADYRESVEVVDSAVFLGDPVGR